MARIIYKAANIVYREVDDGRLYLVLKTSAGYNFSRGRVKRGESKEHAAIRELKEETGLTDENIKIVRGFEEEGSWMLLNKGKMGLINVTYFLIESKKEEITLSNEHRGYCWLNYRDALNILSNNERETIKRTEEFLFQRQHTLSSEEFLKSK